MTVAARQRRVLWRIERMLARTDPRLAAKFGMFGRLTSGEQIPRIEQLTARRSRHRAMSLFSRPRYFQLTVLCAVLSAIALVTILLTGGGAFARCMPTKAAQGYSLQSEGMMHPVVARVRHGNGTGRVEGDEPPVTTLVERASRHAADRR